MNELALFAEIAIFLCDITGKMAEPWEAAGYHVIPVDPQHPVGVHTDGLITRVGHIIDHPVTWRVLREAILSGRVAFVMGFPPCTDVAVSGALHFKAKRQKDPHFQTKAALVAEQCRVIGRLSGARWLFENPASVFSSIFGKAQHSFHPWQFTAICINDNYTKNTCLWASDDFVMPGVAIHEKVAEAIAFVTLQCGRMVPKLKALELTDNNPLVVEWYPDDRIHKCGPSDDRANFRSATPLGFSQAVFNANAPHLRLAANDNFKPPANDNQPQSELF